MTLDLFTLPACICGWPADVVEYKEEVRIGGWCMCADLALAPCVSAPSYAEARERWEREILDGSLRLAGAARQGER